MGLLSELQRRKNRRAARRKIEKYENRYRGEPKERPAPVPVELSFDAFVKEFGGQKISDLIDVKAAMPRNADYIFREYNAIAELKTLEGNFCGPESIRNIKQAFIDAGETTANMFQVIIGSAEIPPHVQELIRKRFRRGIEGRIKEARKQLRTSKAMFGDKDTKTLILFAVDQQPIFGQKQFLFHLANIMGASYADEHTDGVVYFNPNVPTKARSDGMEFSGWFPFYRDDEVNAELSKFVDLLGDRWLTYCAALTGNENPILKLSTFEDMTIALGEG